MKKETLKEKHEKRNTKKEKHEKRNEDGVFPQMSKMDLFKRVLMNHMRYIICKHKYALPIITKKHP